MLLLFAGAPECFIFTGQQKFHYADSSIVIGGGQFLVINIDVSESLSVTLVQFVRDTGPFQVKYKYSIMKDTAIYTIFNAQYIGLAAKVNIHQLFLLV